MKEKQSKVTHLPLQCMLLIIICWLSILASAISLRHILAYPEYVPGTIAVNVTWMKRRLNACQTHRSMYPSTFNRFPVIQPVSSKVRHFSTFFAHFGLPWLCSWDNRGKCWSNAIYLQPFTSYSEILVENCNFFLPLAVNASVWGIPIGISGKKYGPQKTRIMDYQAVKTVWR